MKKMYKILFTIITIISLSNIAYAKDIQYGELRYEITELNIEDTTITFKGWAVIGRTQNGRNEKGENTNQRIRITANTDTKTFTKEVPGDNSSGEWNFFYENYWRAWDDECKKDCQVQKVYNGEKYTFGGKNWDNKCTSDYHSQCYYENIGFTISFNIIEWDLSNNENVTFTIAAKNDDYSKWTSEEKLAITSPVTKIVNSNKNIEINQNSASKELKALAEDAMYRTYDGNLVSCGEDGYCIINPESTYKISDISNNYYPSTANPYPSNTLGSGMYAIKVENKSSKCPGMPKKSNGSDTKGCLMPGNDKSYYVYSSWMKAGGEFSLKVKGTKKCEVKEPKKDKLYCNNSKTLKSDCSVLTVREYNMTKDYSIDSEVEIHQEGTISSVLIPENNSDEKKLKKLYSGGGFKLGIIYNNEISWKYNELSCKKISSEINCTNSIDILNSLMQKKLAKDFEENLKLQSIKFGKDTIDFSKFNKKCYSSGKFENGSKLKTTCVITLPTPNMDKFTGKVIYKNTGKPNINNKYYTPVTWEGTYPIEMTIIGLNRLEIDQAKKDTKEKGKIWTGIWEETFNNCSIKLYPLIKITPGSNPKEEEKITNNFIYRPINIYEPFPNNRMPGVNWYDWWLGENSKSNQKRLKNTYSKQQYYIELDNNTIKKIKTYNKDLRNNGSYLEWKTINEEGNSSFVKKYVKTNKENLVGDSK